MIKLNLLPPEEKNQISQKKTISLTIKAGLSFLGVLLTFFVFLLLIWNFSNSEVKIIQQDLAETQNAFEQASLNQLQKQIKEINQDIATVYNLQKEQLYFSLVLKEISQLTPSQITLENITISKNEPAAKSKEEPFYALKISGLAPHRNDLLNYQTTLEENNLLFELQSPLSNLLTQVNVSFVLEAKINTQQIKP